MLPEVTPLGKISIDLNTLLAYCQKGLGRSVSREIDSRKRDPKTTSSYLSMLAEMKVEGSSPDDVLENPGHLLRHIFFTFLVISDEQTVIDLLEQSNLAIQRSKCINNLDLCIISADMETWRSAIINGCSQQAPFTIRLFYDKCLIAFENEGLSRLWVGYRKKNQPDSTFYLEKK